MKDDARIEDVVVARASEIFAALANPLRLRIVERLCSGDLTVGEIAGEMGIGASGASQHLTILARAGILVPSAEGTSRRYRIRGPRIQAIIRLTEEFCHAHMLYGIPPLNPDDAG